MEEDLQEERHRMIIKELFILKRTGRATTVNRLAEKLGCDGETIRRDIEMLQELGCDLSVEPNGGDWRIWVKKED